MNRTTTFRRVVGVAALCFVFQLCSRLPAQTPEPARRSVAVTVEIPDVSGAKHPVELYKASYALVIGNGSYTGRGVDPLPGALNDVRKVADALRRQGFAVTLLTDLDRAAFQRAFSQFVYGPGADADNRLLVYYAGHGWSEQIATGEDLGYLVMADAPHPSGDRAGFDERAIEMTWIVNQAKKIRANHVLFLFDCCFSGSVLNVRAEVVPRHIADNVRFPVREFITAGRAGQTVPDHSKFRQCFLDLIEGRDAEPIPDGYITGEELGLYLKNKVPEYSEGQNPQFGKIKDPALDKGDFVFVLPKTGGAGVSLVIPPTPRLLDVPKFDTTDLNATEKRRQEEETARQAAEAESLRKFIAAAEDAFNSLDDKDSSAYIDAGEKAAKWREFFDKFSGQDAEADKQLAARFTRARERADHWTNYKPPTPEPTKAAPAVARPSGRAQSGDKYLDVDLGGGVTMRLVRIPAGSFTMGSPSSEADRDSDENQVQVTLTRDFWMGETEVTQAQWRAVMGTTVQEQRDKANTSWSMYGEGNDYPMYYVSWEEAKAFCEKLSAKSKLKFELPTEAQWEYACRAGSTAAYCFGDSDSSLGDYAWYSGNAGGKTHPVKTTKEANAWKLYDMHGNVWEWCSDWYDGTLRGGSDPTGASSGSSRVNRGGSWTNASWNCRSADRGRDVPGNRDSDLGFRVLAVVQ